MCVCAPVCVLVLTRHVLVLQAIRRPCIQQVFLMLHYMHHNMGRYDLCLALADDLTDRGVRTSCCSSCARS